MNWNKREHIPNHEGYRLVVLLDGGELRQERVVKDKRGCHTLEGTPIIHVRGWLPSVSAILDHPHEPV